MAGAGEGSGSGGAAAPRLQVRPLRPEEAHLVPAYFHGAPAADLERMGVDPARLPPPDAWTRSLRQAMAQPPRSAASFYSAWLVDGAPVGYAALKRIRYGLDADIHLHMWSAAHRGQGLGAALFCLSVVDAYGRFALRSLACEPRAANPMPNRMLAKAGFPLVRTYVGSSSELSATTTLNRYDVPLATAQAHLARAGLAVATPGPGGKAAPAGGSRLSARPPRGAAEGPSAQG